MERGILRTAKRWRLHQCCAVGGSGEDVPGVLQFLVKYDISQPEQSLLLFFAPRGNRQMSVKAFVDEPPPQRALAYRLACMCVLETGHEAPPPPAKNPQNALSAGVNMLVLSSAAFPTEPRWVGPIMLTPHTLTHTCTLASLSSPPPNIVIGR